MKYTIKRGNTTLCEVVGIGQQTRKAMLENIVEMSFTLFNPIDFKEGDGVTVYGNKYELRNIPPFEKINERHFNFSLKFEHESYILGDTLVFLPDGNNELKLKASPVNGTLLTHAQLLIQNTSREGLGYSLGVVDDTDMKIIDYNGTNILQALNMLADTFGTEYWIEGKVIHLTKRTGSSGIVLGYGEGKGLLNLRRDKKDDTTIFTRLYVDGGSQNIPASYGNKFLQLPSPYKYISNPSLEAEFGIRERYQTFPDIYPKRTGTISGIGDSELEFFDAGMNFDLNDVILPDTEPELIFKSGIMSGMSVKISEYNPATKKFTVIQNEDGYPSTTVKPATGDTYTIVGIELPQSHITDAQNDLLQAAQTFNEQGTNPLYNEKFSGDCDPLHFKRQNIDLSDKLGLTVNIKEQRPLIDVHKRMETIKRDLQNPWKYEIDFTDNISISPITKSMIDSSKLKTIILGSPTLAGSYSGASFLSMLSSDNGYMLLSGKKMKAGFADTSNDALHAYQSDFASIAGMAREVMSLDFISGFVGAGHKLVNGELEVDTITARKGINAYSLNIREITGVGGSIAVTNVGKIKTVTGANPYVCEFDTDEGTIYNPFQINDIVRCQVWDSAKAKYYLAKVVAVSASSFSLSILEGDGIPQAGDKLFQFGNETNTTRQGLIYATNSDSGAPYLDVLDGVNSASLSGKTRVRLGKLDGITDPLLNPSGYGLYADNVFLKGAFQITGGNAATVGYVDTQYQGVMSQISVLSDDNKLSPAEKTTLKLLYDSIANEVEDLKTQAQQAGLSSSDYNNSFIALQGYATPLLTNLSVTSDISGSMLRSLFSSYGVQKSLLEKAIQNKNATSINGIETYTGANDPIVQAKANGKIFGEGGYLKANLIQAQQLIIDGGGITQSQAASMIANNGTAFIRYIRDWQLCETLGENRLLYYIKAIKDNVNYAAGLPASALTNTSFYGLQYPEYALDGDDTNEAMINYGYPTYSATQLDLGQPTEIDTISIKRQNNASAKGQKTEVSLDGINWVTVYDPIVNGESKKVICDIKMTGVAQLMAASKEVISNVSATAFSNIVRGSSYRYIRVYCQEAVGYAKNLIELQVYSNGVNVAYGKPTYHLGAATTIPTDGDHHSDHFIYSFDWVQLDLIQVMPLDTIKILRRGYEGQTYRNRVEVSNDGLEWVVVGDDAAIDRYVANNSEYVVASVGVQVATAQSTAANALNVATVAQNNITALNTYVDGAFKDGLISEAEAAAIEKYKNTINENKESNNNQYSQLYNNSYLSGTAKTNLASAKTNIDTAITNLLNSINTAIADGKTTTAEKQDVDAKYALYITANNSYTTAVEQASKAIQDAIKALADAAQSTANKANTLITIAYPSNYKIGDLWKPPYDYTADGVPVYSTKIYVAIASNTGWNVNNWKIDENIYVQSTQPLNATSKVNAIWVDTANGNVIKVFDGTNWNIRQDAAIQTAQTTANTANTNATNAQTTANTANANATTAQTTANTANTNATNAQTTANTANANATTANNNAIAAQTTADGKSRTFTSSPSNYKIGDLFIPFATVTLGGTQYKAGEMYTSSANSASFVAAHWTKKVAYTDDTVALARGKTTLGLFAPVSPIVNDNWFDTANRKWWYWNGSVWASNGLTGLQYLYDALPLISEATGGLFLSSVIAVRDSSQVVKAYMNGLSSNTIAFAAGVSNFGLANESRNFSVTNNGDIIIQKDGIDKLRFTASTGQLDISGNITAGSIGGWEIGATGITKAAGANTESWGRTSIYSDARFFLEKHYYGHNEVYDGGNLIHWYTWSGSANLNYTPDDGLVVLNNKDLVNEKRNAVTIDVKPIDYTIDGLPSPLPPANLYSNADIALRIKSGHVYLDKLKDLYNEATYHKGRVRVSEVRGIKFLVLDGSVY